MIGFKKYSPLTTYSTFASKNNRSGKIKILIAEDNLVNQKVVVRLLEKAGFECRVANDGQQAVYAAIATTFDAILMDIQMPNLNGLGATALIRQYEDENHLSRVPIFGLSANALAQDRQKALDAGMDDYFHKPLNLKQIIKKINAMLASNDINSDTLVTLPSLTKSKSAFV